MTSTVDRATVTVDDLAPFAGTDVVHHGQGVPGAAAVAFTSWTHPPLTAFFNAAVTIAPGGSVVPDGLDDEEQAAPIKASRAKRQPQAVLGSDTGLRESPQELRPPQGSS